MKLVEAKKILNDSNYILEASTLKTVEEYQEIYKEAHKKIAKELSGVEGLKLEKFDNKMYDWESRSSLRQGKSYDINYYIEVDGRKKNVAIGSVWITATGNYKYEIYKYKVNRKIQSGTTFGISLSIDNGYRERYDREYDDGHSANTVTGSFNEVKGTIRDTIELVNELANIINNI